VSVKDASPPKLLNGFGCNLHRDSHNVLIKVTLSRQRHCRGTVKEVLSTTVRGLSIVSDTASRIMVVITLWALPGEPKYGFLKSTCFYLTAIILKMAHRSFFETDGPWSVLNGTRTRSTTVELKYGFHRLTIVSLDFVR